MTLNYQQVPGGGQDDILNASGLSAPAIIRGTVYAHLASGLTVGAGVSAGARTANATALQSAITYASVNRKFIEFIPGTYEFTSATGLLVPAQGAGYNLVMRGSRTGTILSQFYATTPGAPILTVGDTTAATVCNGVDISGFTLQYGAAQTGFTSANGLVVGYCTNGRIGDLVISNTTNRVNDGIQVTSSAGNFGMYYSNINVNGFQRHGINYNAPGNGGSTWDNINVNNGTTGTTAVTGNYLLIQNTATDMLFNHLSFKFGSCNIMMSAVAGGVRNLVINDFNCETIKLTGANPVMFDIAETAILINGWGLIDPLVQAAGLTGSPAMFRDFTGAASNIQVNNLSWYGNTAGGVDTAFALLAFVGGNANDDASIVQFTNCRLRDTVGNYAFGGSVFMDVHQPVALTYMPLAWARYTYGPSKSTVERPIVRIVSVAAVYGQWEDSTIIVPASITSFSLTLEDTMGGTGTQFTRTGNTCRVRRLSGTASGTLTILNGGVAAGTLATNTTSATDLWYQFNGTNWVSVTPVT